MCRVNPMVRRRGNGTSSARQSTYELRAVNAVRPAGRLRAGILILLFVTDKFSDRPMRKEAHKMTPYKVCSFSFEISEVCGHEPPFGALLSGLSFRLSR